MGRQLERAPSRTIFGQPTLGPLTQSQQSAPRPVLGQTALLGELHQEVGRLRRLCQQQEERLERLERQTRTDWRGAGWPSAHRPVHFEIDP
ncbi:hypothetical protein [Deinococcus sp.]|uniref:hypothetical protein n=1 Tax=Deinococcus sp. TaxID=47478 RepID=UPI003CC5118A